MEVDDLSDDASLQAAFTESVHKYGLVTAAQRDGQPTPPRHHAN